MPKSLSIAHYPVEFFDIIAQCKARQSVRTRFTKKAQAYATRLDFYGFRRALKTAGALAADEVKRDVDLVHVRIEPEGEEWLCVFHHADDTPTATAVRDALKSMPPIVPTSPAAPVVLPPAFISQTPSDDTDDVLARRLRTGPCSQCDPSLACYTPGTKCLKA